ncbi:MAG: ATP-dependent Clp protease ATP-binding subunit [Sulfurimicrobium sp.]|nr:ATP-dependent Clp protease ATP-binding subunit [Sulfurimicrobium sp.]
MSNEEFLGWKRRCGDILDAAANEALLQKQGHLGVEALFVAMLSSPGGQVAETLRGCGIDAKGVCDVVRREAGTGKGGGDSNHVLTPRLATILHAASELAGDGAISEAHLLQGMLLEGEGLPIRYLASIGHTTTTLLGILNPAAKASAGDETRLTRGADVADFTRCQSSQLAPASTPSSCEHAVPGPSIKPVGDIPASLPTPTLDQFGRDLAKLARAGRLSDALGRESEIEQVITVLARTQKSNPLLLGDAGVGKTAIVEGLAWRIARGLVPPVLIGKRIVELDMGGLTAGTTLRGQFEARIQQVVKEASNAPEVILFIDEIHTIVGAGRGEGSANDAAQMFKPALARGDLSCIGATTEAEYARYIRKDPALERRFSPVMISELRPEATRSILEKVAPGIIEKQASAGYRLTIAPEALSAAVSLTDKYVKDRNQPDKSIDAIDIACARAVVKGRAAVSAEDVAQVISEWTGIPAGQLGADDRQRYAQMEAVLEQRVVGQDAAISAVSRSVRTALSGMKAPNRPIGVFLFCGPSGVGKTKLAKELATFLFGTADTLIRFDMNEYQDKSTISNLIGSARGYLDSEQGGQFTEALRRKPYSVVLLDEIEKAHPDILNTFLAVFDDGRITDNQGRVIDCSNAVFILTSNMGMGAARVEQAGTEELRALAAQFIRPELVNRITEVVRFEPLGSYELELVLDQVLGEKLSAFRAAQQLDVTVDNSAKQLMLSIEMDPQMGARPLERVVEQMLVQPLVDAVFAGQIKPGSVTAIARAGRIAFTTTKLEEGL